MVVTFHGTQRVGQIVAAFPGASNLMKAHGIDFCCGGGHKLSDALREQGIEESWFLAQLHHAFAEAQRPQGSPETDWRAAPLGALVQRIAAVHHAYLKQELPLLSGFVDKIRRVHEVRHPELATLNRLFQEFRAELETHMVSEEEEQFPLVQAYERTGDREDLLRALQAVDRLETEHQQAGQLLADIRAVTGSFQLPPDACRTYTLTYQKLADLESDMFMHVHLENNILFSRLRQAAEALDGLRAVPAHIRHLHGEPGEKIPKSWSADFEQEPYLDHEDLVITDALDAIAATHVVDDHHSTYVNLVTPGALGDPARYLIPALLQTLGDKVRVEEAGECGCGGFVVRVWRLAN